MKKTIICMLLAASAVQGVKAQDQERAVMKGQNSINVYYGVNLLRGFYKSVASSSGADVKITGMGPIGLVFEHMVTDAIGLGAELGYGSTNVSWRDVSEDIFSGTAQTYDYTVKFSTIRAQVRANFHFAKSSNFDAYFLISAGYRGQNFSYTTTDPTWQGTSIKNPLMFGLKPGLGLRYFFTDNIGLNMEIALGSPVMCGGLSLRF
jgi:outer membrane protein W